MIEHEYVTLKLVNGDNIIALMVDEDENRFIILYPIQMKSIRVEGSNKEIIAGSPWCSFTDHEVFQIWKTDIIFIKPLNDSTIEYYKKLVDTTQLPYDPEDEYDEDLDELDLSYIQPESKTIH